VTTKNYKKQVLEAVVGPVFNDQLGWEHWDSDGLFQENNAPVHGAGRARSLQKWKKELGLRLFDWPPSSPDLSPIENIWRLLKQRIHSQKQPSRTRTGLIQAIKEE